MRRENRLGAFGKPPLPREQLTPRRYLNELNRPTLMPLQSSIQQMYDECRALLLAACLDVDDPVQSQELMSAVHGGGPARRRLEGRLVDYYS